MDAVEILALRTHPAIKLPPLMLALGWRYLVPDFDKRAFDERAGSFGARVAALLPAAPVPWAVSVVGGHVSAPRRISDLMLMTSSSGDLRPTRNCHPCIPIPAVFVPSMLPPVHALKYQSLLFG